MNLTNISFEGKNGIITGSAQGIGRGIADLFVALGGKAIVVDINEETAKKAAQELGNAVYYICDLGNAVQTKEVFERICKEQEHVDVLINNAGIVNTEDFETLRLESWQKVMDIDLTAVFVACQVCMNHMATIGGGRIVNIASIAAAVGGGLLGTAAYGAAKNGVKALTKSVAKAGSKYNVACNSICPGYTRTPLVATHFTPEKEAKVLEASALHRSCSTEEMANAVLFLASEAASFIQGENLNVDGGVLMNG